jgi:hypothetical protein
MGVEVGLRKQREASKSKKGGGMSMPEVTAIEACQILQGDVSVDTIRRAVDTGKLRGRRKGEKRAVRVEVEGLREWADAMHYRFDEQLAQALGK